MSIRLPRIFGILLVCLVLSLSKAQAAPGNLDFSFGIQGLVLTDTHDILTGDSGVGAALSVAIHPEGDPNEGKIVAVGFAQTSGHAFALARYNPDGSLDTTFGTHGVIETDIGGEDLLLAVVIYGPEDPNAGKILAAGLSDSLPPSSFALIRYCPDG
ncbi:MAG TPA: delta-60 repeat domain-containing protein, partial [bacterium]|nr:delta-60 repeat domain-containing protein [bacterium]